MDKIDESGMSSSSISNKRSSSKRMFSMNNFINPKGDTSTPNLRDFENNNSTGEELKRVDSRAIKINRNIFGKINSKGATSDTKQPEVVSDERLPDKSERLYEDVDNSHENINIDSDGAVERAISKANEVHQDEEKQDTRTSNQKSHLKFLQFILGAAVRQPAQKRTSEFLPSDLGGGNRPLQPIGEDPHEGYIENLHENTNAGNIRRNSKLIEKTDSYVNSDRSYNDLNLIRKKSSVHNTILHEMGAIAHQQSSKNDNDLKSQESIERSNEK